MRRRAWSLPLDPDADVQSSGQPAATVDVDPAIERFALRSRAARSAALERKVLRLERYSHSTFKIG